MPWCPVCKDEYKEGITVCADCGAKLVDDLSLVEEERESVEESLEEFDEETVMKVASVIAAKVESGNLDKEAEEFLLELDEEEVSKISGSPTVYVNNEEKAAENRASAITLIAVGIIGMVGVILFMAGVFPITVSEFSKYIIGGVMGALFILFLIMGCVSLRNFKLFSSKAHKENNLTERIKTWCLENIVGDEVDDKLGIKGMAPELSYFKRNAYMKKAINSQFINLDDGYLERLIDEIYPEIFEKEEN